MTELIIPFIENNIFNFIAFLLILFVEVNLLLINWTARSKYGEYFREMNGVWKFFDDKGWTSISLIIHLIIVSNLVWYLFLGSSTEILWCVLGMLFTNWTVDRLTLEWRGKCILTDCPDLEHKKKCIACKEVDKYNITGTINLRLTEKKDDFSYRLKARIKEIMER